MYVLVIFLFNLYFFKEKYNPNIISFVWDLDNIDKEDSVII